MFKTPNDDGPGQPMDHSSPRAGESTPSSTPEVRGEIGDTTLFPALTLSDRSPSKSSEGSSSRHDPSPRALAAPRTATTRRLSFSRDVPSPRPKLHFSSPSPTLFSRPLSVPETKQPNGELISRLSQISGRGWSVEKEQWVRQVMQQPVPVDNLPQISILDQFKLQKNKKNIRSFVKEQLDRAKAAQVFLEFHQQKKKALSLLLNEGEERDYQKTFVECLMSACWAENLIGEHNAIDYYQQQKSTRMEYGGAAFERLNFFDQRTTRSRSQSDEVKEKKTKEESKESTASLFSIEMNPRKVVGRFHSSPETRTDSHLLVIPSSTDTTSPLIHASVLCAREKAQTNKRSGGYARIYGTKNSESLLLCGVLRQCFYSHF